MKMKIKWEYEHKGAHTHFESDWLEQSFILPIVDDLQKIGRAKTIVVMDELGNEWTRKEFIKLGQQLEQEPTEITIYFDGGFQLETLKAGIGIVMYYKKNRKQWRIRLNDQLDELDSNNEAEYVALFRAVQLLEEMGVRNTICTFKGDSHVVLKQLSGEWPCFEDSFNRWLDRIEEKIHTLGITPLYKPINRKQNKEADKLANQALEGIMVNSERQLE
ncbi:ribonuclease HI [Oikeobacillus pervagus]|uniref:Ribonuclease HI n=1 Tax=Oikeobacillus pervagus TaxID=1325931 RepID=A0AAJ1SVH9_9BACI|nr:reverse transcriptase-like protein [Oikeobacillus pervagus]MDQ0213623.1 ribonuclease HI [Oikeobacillus pervagus]